MKISGRRGQVLRVILRTRVTSDGWCSLGIVNIKSECCASELIGDLKLLSLGIRWDCRPSAGGKGARSTGVEGLASGPSRGRRKVVSHRWEVEGSRWR